MSGLVDDNTDICDLLRTVLEESGASVAVAQSVRGAVQAFRRCPEHAVIADIRLGNSDGYRLVEAMRECNAEHRRVSPVVALTGHPSPEYEATAIAAGIDA